MRVRLLPFVALALLVAVRPGAADDKKPVAPKKPTLVVRISSFDSVLANLKYVAKLVGQENQLAQVEGLLKSPIGKKVLTAIDSTRPIGVYGYLEAGLVDSSGAILLPVGDEAAFTETLKSFQLNPEKESDDVYKLEHPLVPFPVYYKFANKYAYVTVREKEILANDKLLDPAKILAGDSTLSAVINLDEIPKGLKETALSTFALQQSTIKENEIAGETPEQKKFRIAVIDELFARSQQLVSEGGALSLSFNLDPKTGTLAAAASLSGQPDSKLASDIAGWAKVTSVAAGILGSDAPVNFQAHFELPASIKAALAPVIDEGVKKTIEMAKKEGQSEIAEPFMKALIPTAKMGVFDGGACLRGPDSSGHYTAIGALKLQDGKALEQSLKTVLQDKKISKDLKATVTFDVETVGDVHIHKLVPEKVDEKSKALLGDEAIYYAVRDDAFIGVAGSGALDAMKAAISASPAPGKLVRIDLAMSKLAPIIAADRKMDPEKLKKAFKPGEDTIRISLEGGKVLKANAELKLQLLKSFVAIDQSKIN
jgi:hypothetical protein